MEEWGLQADNSITEKLPRDEVQLFGNDDLRERKERCGDAGVGQGDSSSGPEMVTRGFHVWEKIR